MEITIQITTLIQNIVLIITGIIGTILAIKGYGSWKEQMRGADLYSVQKKLMGGMIDYRNALEHVRNPFMQYDKKDGESDDDAMVRAYSQRINVLKDARRDLEMAIRELVIIKGIDQEKVFQGIWEWYASTVTAVQMHFQAKSRGDYNGVQSDSDRKWREKQREIMYSTSENDVIMVPFNKRMKEIEAYIALLK